jgi:hypothetical protein
MRRTVLDTCKGEAFLQLRDEAIIRLHRNLRARAEHRGADVPDLWPAERGVRGPAPNGIKIMIKRRGAAAGLTGMRAHRRRHHFTHEWKRTGGDTGDRSRFQQMLRTRRGFFQRATWTVAHVRPGSGTQRPKPGRVEGGPGIAWGVEPDGRGSGCHDDALLARLRARELPGLRSPLRPATLTCTFSLITDLRSSGCQPSLSHRPVGRPGAAGRGRRTRGALTSMPS